MKYTRAKIISITPIADKPGWDSILVHHLDNADVIVEQDMHQVERTPAGEEKFKAMILAKCYAYNQIYSDSTSLIVDAELYPHKTYTVTGVSLAGIVTFILTDDGLLTGKAIFNQIDSVQLTSEKDVTSVAQMASVGIKTVSADLKTLVANPRSQF